MAYEKQNFKDGNVLTAEHLNHIEDGIHELNVEIDKMSAEIDTKIDTKIDAYIEETLGGEY